MVNRSSGNFKKANPKKAQAPARFPASVQAIQKKRPLHEVLSLDVALENWSEDERQEFEARFTKRFRRSFWSTEREKPTHWQFYCPLCGCTRRLPHAPTPWTALNLARVGVTTAVVTLALSPWLDWMGVISFVPLWVVFEVIFRVRTRAQLVCDQCGFDPTLYMTDVARARREVEEFWKAKLAPGAGAPARKNQSRVADSEGRDALQGERLPSGEKTFEDPLQQGETFLDSG